MERDMEYFKPKELVTRIGHEQDLWPLALSSELFANGLDACEKAGQAPLIAVTLGEDCLTVCDNGSGIPEGTVNASINYAVRVSDNIHWVSPTRGQLGNALKCLYAASFVAGGCHGRVEFEARGKLHRIDVTLDEISEKPLLTATTQEGDFVKAGTLVRLYYPSAASHLMPPGGRHFYNAAEDEDDGTAFSQGIRTLPGLVRAFHAFNPHASFRLATPQREEVFAASNAGWAKWSPNKPTDANWYTLEQLRGLIAAFVKIEMEGGEGLSVREFVSKFHGMRGSAVQHQVVSAAGLERGTKLSDLVKGRTINTSAVKALLTAMQQATTFPVKAADLGEIGEGHLGRCLERHYGVVPESIRYKRVRGKEPGHPFVLEVGMGVRRNPVARCEVNVGVNWNPALRVPFGELTEMLGAARVDSFDPVVVLAHPALPRPPFADSGKCQLTLTPAVAAALEECVCKVAAAHTKAKDRADKKHRLRAEQVEKLQRGDDRCKRAELKAVSERYIPESYVKASGSEGYPAQARQIAYVNRELVLQAGVPKYFSTLQTFTQRILPNYMAANKTATAAWDVVFDARGHLQEPHTDTVVPLGTLEVRDYLNQWTGLELPPASTGISIKFLVPTSGPVNRFKYALFIEKEGFEPLLRAARIKERFDLPWWSTKGMSVTAARWLAEKLAERGVRILVLHDFDKSGFSICHKLSANTRRYQFRTTPQVTPLGLRLEDVLHWRLGGEPVQYDVTKDPKINLRICGATREEREYLVRRRTASGWEGQRCELNALTSPQFVSLLERKLVREGVAKVVPPEPVLVQAFHRAVALEHVRGIIDTALPQAEAAAQATPVPAHLSRQVKDRIKGTATPWDEAIAELARSAAQAHPLRPR
jgi:hypothetical protein